MLWYWCRREYNALAANAAFDMNISEPHSKKVIISGIKMIAKDMGSGVNEKYTCI